MSSIVIIGSGNIASAFAAALSEAGVPPVQIFARNADHARAIAESCGCGYACEPEQLAKADLYLICVSDNAIAKVAAALDFGDSVVAHTAASVSVDSLPAKIANRAVLYPLQTFTKGRRVEFSTTPLLIEGMTPKAHDTVGELARRLSNTVLDVDSSKRAMLHVAAVFACNFTNYMYIVGEELAQKAGFDFSILKPLIAETANKATECISPRDVQTGPAIRNDYLTKSKHCELLQERVDLQNIYINLSKNIWETLKKI